MSVLLVSAAEERDGCDDRVGKEVDMKILDPGHYYSLDRLDFDETEDPVLLRFVKRVGDKFPGNEAPPYDGTTTQEVLRALIDRTKYVDEQIHFLANEHVLSHLRWALTWLEHRAAIARDDVVIAESMWNHLDHIETLPTCAQCGHVLCERKEH